MHLKYTGSTHMFPKLYVEPVLMWPLQISQKKQIKHKEKKSTISNRQRMMKHYNAQQMFIDEKDCFSLRPLKTVITKQQIFLSVKNPDKHLKTFAVWLKGCANIDFYCFDKNSLHICIPRHTYQELSCYSYIVTKYRVQNLKFRSFIKPEVELL